MTDPYLTLFVPGDRPERYDKAARAGADAIIVDLEDAVRDGAKDEARRTLSAALTNHELPGAVFVRINAAGTPFFEDDVAAVATLSITGIVVPKAESGAEIEALRARLPGFEIQAIVESAKGVGQVREVAEAADRTMFGSLDYAVSIGAEHRREALLHARCELVLAAMLAGRPAPLDGVTTAIDDAALIEDEAAYAAGLGFKGKILIHPRQIAPAIRGFAPRESDVEQARRIVAASGGEAVRLDGRMVDVPVVQAALRLIERHERLETRLNALEARA